MGLTHYLASLLRRWYLVVAGLLLGGLAAFGLLQVLTPQYESNIQLFVSTSSGGGDLASVAQGGEFSQARTASYAQLLDGRDLAARVIDDLGIDATPEELTDGITAQVLPETVILDVTVTDSSPERALAIAQSLGEEFAEVVRQVETPAGESTVPVQVSVVATPQLPSEPASPSPVMTIAAGLLLGLALGAVVAVVRDRLDTSLRSETAAAAAAGAPVLGLIPQSDAADLRPRGDTSAPVAESYRQVRTNLQFVSVDTHPRVLMVTSPEQSEGKSTTAIHLAEALVQAGRRVLLVEADLRRPRVVSRLGLVSGAGLTNVLAGTADTDDVVQPVGDGRLSVLAAGATAPNPSELLASNAMADLLATFSASYDVVVLDAAPLLPVADAAGLAALVDGVVLVLRWGQTTQESAERSRALLDRAGVRVLGAVLTFAPRRTTGRYTYSADEVAPAPPRGATAGRRATAAFRRRRTDEISVPAPPAVEAPRRGPTTAGGAGSARTGAAAGATSANGKAGAVKGKVKAAASRPPGSSSRGRGAR